jgi:HK97 family phage portal protein
MSKFAETLAKAKTPGSAVLNAWRLSHGPEATGKINNLNETRQSLTVQELANLIGGGAVSSAGPVVSESTALRVSAVYACVALIAGAISTLPLPIYERTATGRARVDHPYFWMLNEQPDENISAAVFWEYMASARLFHGDCFAEILRSSFRSTRVTGLKAHHPLRVTPFFNEDEELFYRVMPLKGSQYIVSPSDMIHIPSLGYDGLTSPSPITYAARQAVGTSIATADYNGRFFSNGARPDFALMTDGTITEDQAKMLRTTWHDRHGGAGNAHLPAILTGGLKVQQLTMTPEDSQILATCSWNLEEICRVLGVPPHMVGSTEKSSSWGTGQENMGRGFVKYTLLRDLRKFEQEINRKFWPMREKYFVEFDVSGIERGDLKSENESLRVALGRAGEPGWLSVNEVRRLKLLPPIEGGDTVATAVPPVTPLPSGGVASAEPK